mmetsp:Transcript_4654/g.15513  ORF Transcript_4654/g.15513 Transcript_4654/m.15513 type:complete len:250 (-) Transcript_4654:395-1144(-)
MLPGWQRCTRISVRSDSFGRASPASAVRRRLAKRRRPSAVWAGGRREEDVCGSRGVVGELEPDRSRSSLLIARLYANQNAKHGARLQCHGSALAATSRRALRLHDPNQRARRAARVRRRGRGRRAGGRGGRRGRPCCAGGRVGARSLGAACSAPLQGFALHPHSNPRETGPPPARGAPTQHKQTCLDAERAARASARAARSATARCCATTSRASPSPPSAASRAAAASSASRVSSMRRRAASSRCSSRT